MQDAAQLQQAVQAVASGAELLRVAAMVRAFSPSAVLSEGLVGQALLDPLSSLLNVVKLDTPPARGRPRSAPRRAPKAGAKKSRFPAPVDLKGFGLRARLWGDDGRPESGKVDKQAEASNCRALLLEVIRRASFDWVLYRGSSVLQKRMYAESAYNWLFVEEPGTPLWETRVRSGRELTAFVTICELLDIDPDLLREQVRTLTHRDIMSAGRPAERRKHKNGDEAAHGDDLRVFDVDVDSLPVFDTLYTMNPDS